MAAKLYVAEPDPKTGVIPQFDRYFTLEDVSLAELDARNFAYRYFMKTATIDITGKSKQYVGDLFIGGTHPAANGGAWLAVVKGFCGLLDTPSGVSITPRLPAHWQKIVVQYRYAQNAYEITVEKERVQVRVLEQRGPHPEFVVRGQPQLPTR